MKTIDDLKAAFAGESQANRKYLAWAKQADREGHPGIAHLFRALSGRTRLYRQYRDRSVVPVLGFRNHTDR